MKGKHHAEEQEGYERRLAAQARFRQLELQVRACEQGLQVELIDNAFEEALRALAQLGLGCFQIALVLGAQFFAPCRTDFKRMASLSCANTGMPSVTMVAKAATDAITMTMKCGSVSVVTITSKLGIAGHSEIEVDHLAHDKNARRHP